MNSTTDRIERKILLSAPCSRVWFALSDAETFGSWFGVALAGQTFVAGQHATGRITYPGYEHLVWDVVIERIQPESRLSFRWHPYAIDPDVDYTQEPTTLVEFNLEDHESECLLRVVESGFDRIAQPRRDEAFAMNSRGWDEQMNNIEKFVVGF